MYPTEPFEIFASLTYFGAKYPTSRASIFLLVLRKWSVSHFLISQENTFT
jgi:hypothetical protein